tara:strand:+ start:1365 stop:1997 length:633 start_codon:yes stop_codon:yes gene_type:complete
MIQLRGVYPNLFVEKNIAIVGSSSKLKTQEYGGLIDSFDEVVRFNRAPTEGWEKYVGSKTTLRVANNHVFANVKHNVGGDENCQDWKPEGQPQNFIKDLKNQKILLLNKDSSAWESREEHIDETSTAFLGDYICTEIYGGVMSPSVGYSFICICIMNNIKPELFGFGLEEKNEKASHYWENKDKIISSHGYQLERENIRKWHETKKLLIR